jgi:hypothetical protein
VSDEDTPLDWLQTQVVTDLTRWRGLEAAYAVDAEREGGTLWRQARDRVADCEAKLAIIGQCEAALPIAGEDKDEHYQDGRDDDEIMRDEALAELADDILALLADGCKHREGWADHWACPACGVALHELPEGHAWAIPMDGGPVTCQNFTPVSPAEFMARKPPERS